MKQAGWYWTRPKTLPHPFKLCKLWVVVDGVHTFPPVGVMAMDDFGSLVEVKPWAA